MASGWPRANGWKPEEADLGWTNSCPSRPQMEQATWQGSGSATQGCGERNTAHSLWSSLGGRPSWGGLRDESTGAGGRGGGWLCIEHATLWHLSAGPGAQLCPPPSTPRRTLLTFAQAQGPCPPWSRLPPEGWPGGLYIKAHVEKQERSL